MSLAPITLTTDKSTAVIENTHRKLRQDESGLSITVTVLNKDNTPYNLTGKSLVFCENKQNNKIIVDNGKGDNSGRFYRNSDNDINGIFTYVLQEDAYVASGKAWFEITDGTTVDSTKDFYFDVEKDADINISNNDYVGSLKALETAMAGAQGKITSDIADMEAQITKKIADAKAANEGEITQALKNLTDQTTVALSNADEYTKKLATLQSQWDSELQSIKNKTNADTDSAVKAINDRYTNDFNKIKSDFANWQTSTTQKYQKQVDGILAQVQKNGTEVADVQKQVNDTVAKMQALTQHFSKIDFTQFIKPSDLGNYYTKKEVNDRLASAGKVKTVNHASPDDFGNIQIDMGVTHYNDQTGKVKTVNHASPDDSGNIQIDTSGKVKTVNHASPDGSGNITIPAGGVTSFNGKKGDITFKVVHDNYDSPQAAFDASKIEDGIHVYSPDNGPTSAVVDGETITVSKNHDAIVQLQQQFGSLQGTVNGKDNASDITNLSGRIDTNQSNITQLQQQSASLQGIVNGNSANIAQAQQDIIALQSATSNLSGYETTVDAGTLADRITALENKKPIRAWSQNDAVAKSQSSNDEYYW